MHLDVRFTAARPARACATTLLLLGLTLSTQALAQVSALGRLEPWHGALKITAPITPESTGGIVLGQLLVERGDNVKAGQLLAVTEAAPLMQAQVATAKAEREYRSRQATAANSAATAACVEAKVAEQASQRRQDLLARKLISNEAAEQAKGEADAGKAGCASARASAQAATAAVALADAELKRAQAVLQRS